MSQLTVTAAAGLGYIQGVHDSVQAAGAICTPRGAEVGQLSSAVLKYLREHPEQLHTNAAALTVSALGQAFPCPKR
ncbi:MAG: Rap1a/Tai family immunity protein [Vicinamibacteria bacterium]